MRNVEIGRRYKHFKGKNYKVIAIAYHSETGEKLVIYNQLYEPYQTYARPYSMFISEVDKNKYPNIKQKYRFQEI